MFVPVAACCTEDATSQCSPALGRSTFGRISRVAPTGAFEPATARTAPPITTYRDFARSCDSGLECVDQDILAWYRREGRTWEEVVDERRVIPSILEQIRALRAVPESERQAVVRGDTGTRLLRVIERLRQPSTKGLDGVSVELGESWADHFMRREPEERGRE